MYAVFFISAFSSLKNFTFTLKLNFAVSLPTGTAILIPFSKSFCVYFVSLSFTLIDEFTNSTYSEIGSFTSVSPSMLQEFESKIV